MNINWYPGHMKKTSESISENLKKVDLVMELIDARAPVASRNPRIPILTEGKERIILFNKADLADEEENNKWMESFKKENIPAVKINANQKKGFSKLFQTIDEVMKEKRKRDKEKGIKSKMVRAMIVGVPNVGKSTLINSLANRKSAKVGNTPGVTKQNQWIKVGNKLQLLDTPGVLWPKFESEKLALHLAFIGSIKDEVLPIEDVALKFIEFMRDEYPENLEKRYNVDTNQMPLDIMEDIGRKRGAIISGGYIDYTRVTNIVLDEFRKGKLGRITLEKADV